MFKQIIRWWKFRQTVLRGILIRLRNDPDGWRKSTLYDDKYFYVGSGDTRGSRPIIVIGTFFCRVSLYDRNFYYALWSGGSAIIDRIYFNDDCVAQLIESTKFGPTFNHLLQA